MLMRRAEVNPGSFATGSQEVSAGIFFYTHTKNETSAGVVLSLSTVLSRSAVEPLSYSREIIRA